MESQVTCKTSLQAANLTTNVAHGLTSCSNRLPPEAPAKKQTRQWAAWTRQEEESFFTALRQVGKNFEKITYRVQSKNKDQVRHYYYRLVRRMNKLLDPDFRLNAKNSKETVAAMLRWWSLLEKYSCSASRLHLKPRRFKAFIEALAHQLSKDKRKNVKRRSMPRENAVATMNLNQEVALGHDASGVKVVPLNRQNIRKFGSRRGSSSRCSRKGDLLALKTTRRQQKAGVSVSAAAYRKWKKAAIAGVSLVADAAEHLEREDTLKESVQVQSPSGQSNLDTGEDLPSVPSIAEKILDKNDAENPVKLKLQLFPVDEGTRRALEVDRCNPHLELTLSGRKKISSVIEHLKQKWGNSSIASGKIKLFPFNIQEDLVACPRWSKDSSHTAAEIHKLIGSPAIFRLRYGWLLHDDPVVFTSELALASCLNSGKIAEEVRNENQLCLDSTLLSPPRNPAKLTDNLHNSGTVAVAPSLPGGISDETFRHANALNTIEIPATLESTAHGSCMGMADAGARTVEIVNADNFITCKVPNVSAHECVEGYMNLSSGALLSEVEVPNKMDIHHDETCIETSQNMQQIPLISDSFDAAIAAHLSKYQDSVCYQGSLTPHTSSIWDAEETCDAFSFKKKGNSDQNGLDLGGNICPGTYGKIMGGHEVKGSPESMIPVENPVGCDMMDEGHSNPLKDLADVYWPDSLGPLDLDIRSCRFQSDAMILCDSLGGLNSFLASSSDSFLNCSPFGVDKKRPMAAMPLGNQEATARL